MSFLQKKLTKANILYLLPFIALFGFILFQNLIVGYSHDDFTYKSMMRAYPNIIDYSIMRYYTWTNRNISEAVVLFFLKSNIWLWRILDAIIYPAIAYLIIKLTHKEKDLKYSIICCILIAIFYISVKSAIASTGFITTSIDYIWGILCLLIHFYLLKQVIFKNKVKGTLKLVLVHLICIATFVFAITNEQLAMVALGFYVFGFLHAIYRKFTIPNITYLYVIILLLSLMNAILCPGNYNRIAVALKFYPWYGPLNVLDKINIGVSNILNTTITNCNLITAVTLGLLRLYNYVNTNKDRLKQFIGFIPLIIVIIFWICTIYYPSLISLMCANITLTGYHPATTYSLIVSLIIYAIFVGSLIYTFIIMFKTNKKLGYCVVAISLIGLGSAVMYGFTPTILSKERMYIYTNACCLIISCLLTIEYIKIKK